MFVRLLSLVAVFLPLSLSAQAPESVMVVEAYSGKILVASNAGLKRPVASLNKIATAVVAIDWATAAGRDIATVMVTAPQTVSLVGGPNPMNLQPGDRLSLRDALYSALLGSDNLAALTIADHVGRDLLARRGKDGDPVASFVAEMGRLGQAVGMTQTNFVNPHGLDIRNNKGYSTAADIAKLSVYAMRRNAFNFIVRQPNRNVTVSGPGGNRKFLVRNTNQLVGEPGILGIKTGSTNAAGQCLAVCMDREPLVRMKADGNKGATPRRLIVVILNNPNRFDRARSLIRQGWSIYDPWLAAGAPVTDQKREILAIPPVQ
jgi:D-alanyl-D-alanine carboxypeptidase (penicillin-binding protein 5/6)